MREDGTSSFWSWEGIAQIWLYMLTLLYQQRISYSQQAVHRNSLVSWHELGERPEHCLWACCIWWCVAMLFKNSTVWSYNERKRKETRKTRREEGGRGRKGRMEKKREGRKGKRKEPLKPQLPLDIFRGSSCRYILKILIFSSWVTDEKKEQILRI